MTETREYLTAPHFAAKVEWEGGVVEALTYGLKVDHLDPDDPVSVELRSKWGELQAIWDGQMRQLVDEVGRLCETLAEHNDEGEG